MHGYGIRLWNSRYNRIECNAFERVRDLTFANSPALELLDFLERLAPFSSPSLILRDPAPRMVR